MAASTAHNYFPAARMTRRQRLAAAIGGLSLVLGATGPNAFGQVRPRPAAVAARAAAAAAAPTATGVGLDALSDDAVMNELAGRGVNSLLTRLFDDRKVAQADRDAFKALQALRELAIPKPISDSARIDLLKRSIDGLSTLKDKLTDPDQLSTFGATIFSRGIDPDVNILDYWGDNPVRQARVGPAAALAVEMLNKASVEYAARAEAIVNKAKGPNDPLLNQYEMLDQRSNSAKWVANLAIYDQVIGVDVTKPGGWDERKKLADTAIKYLTDFATPDSGVAPLVELKLGHYYMVKGDYSAAKKHFQNVIDKTLMVEKQPTPMQPEPNEFQQNEARYFSIVSDVMAKKLPEADTGYDALVTWQQGVTNAGFKAAAQQNEAQVLMLKFRILSAKADASPAGPAKEKFDRDGEEALNKLGSINEGFKTLISEQLVSRVHDDTDLSKLGVGVLEALVDRGSLEWAKPEGQPYDQKILNRGLEAAKVVAGKKLGEAGATASEIENAKLRVALFLQKQGKLLEAANQYLDYAVDPLYQSKANAAKAVDTAQYLAIQLFSKNSKDEATGNLYDRMLKVAANKPFDNPNLYYFYALRLQTHEENIPEAILFYSKVKAGDKKEFDARYYQMVLTEQQLDKTSDIALKSQLVRELLELSAKVRPLAQAALAAAGADANAQNRAKYRMAHSTLIEAELAIQQTPPQPKRTLQVLDGFEQVVGAMPQGQALISRATFLRARAYIADQQIAKAIDEVQKLAANPATADYAVGMVQDLLERLQKDFKEAQQAGNKAAMGRIANDKAQLTGLLMPFALKQTDPAKKKQLVHDITAFDADAKFTAGELLPDSTPAEKSLKTQRIKEALDIYLRLQAENKDDTRMAINIAKCQFALGDYLNSIIGYSTLLRDAKLGTPTILAKDAKGEYTISQDNDDYWDAIYRLNMGRFRYAQQNPGADGGAKALEAAKKSILPLFTVNLEKTGGKMHAEYVQLRNLLDPSAASQTTQPAAGAQTPPPTTPQTSTPPASTPPASTPPTSTPASAPAAAAPATRPTVPAPAR